MEELQELKLVVSEQLSEKFVEFCIKALAYGIGSIPTWPHFIKNGFTPTNRGFDSQSKSYKEGESIVYGPKKHDFNSFSRFHDVKTINQLLLNSAKNFPNRKCLGRRQLIRKEVENCIKTTKTTVKYEFGQYIWYTYYEVSKMVLAISSNLIDMGFNESKKIAIFCNTSPEWLMTAMALSQISSPFVTLYPTLSDDAVIHSLNTSKVSGIMVDEKSLTRLEKFIGQLPRIKHVIVSSYIEKIVDIPYLEGIFITEFESLLSASPNKTDPFSKQPQNTDDMVVIMFTSGSAGIPKGVMISHKNILATLNAVSDIPEFKKHNVFAAFLPSSHVFEFSFEIGMIGFGKTIGFATPRTLFDTSDMIITGTKGDLAVLKPNIIITVPLLLERIKNKVIEKVQCQSRLKRLIFQTCYNIKMNYRKFGFSTPIIDKLIFKPTINLFGGHLCIGFIGGSCIPRNIEEFANICFGKFKQGYGLTETCSGICLTHSNYNPTGTTGAMLTNARIKLLPWVEGNYCPDDKPYPRGEISVSGDCLASGYYKNKKLTNSCFHVDKQTGIRWFDTGDIGMITSDGSLKIIDRKKDIIKLSQGEYISLVQIESKISECPLVELNCVLPNKSMQHLVALIIPNRDKVEQYLIHNNIIKSGCDIDKLLEKKSICSQLSDEVKIFIINLLPKNEIPTKIYVLSDIWTPESNLITPTLKLKRQEISRHYEHLLS